MGTFRIDFEIANPAVPETRRVIRNALVDTGAELSWIPSDVLESLGIERYARSRRAVEPASGRRRPRAGSRDWLSRGER